MTPTEPALRCQPLSFALLRRALGIGVKRFAQAPGVSIVGALPLTLFAAAVLAALAGRGLTPIGLALAGGFMLVGPAFLAGFLRVARALEAGEPPRIAHLAEGFRKASPGLWVLALACSFLFLVWVTDAGTLYAMTVGGTAVGPAAALVEPGESLVRFYLWGGATGAAIAFIGFCISAFSVPLICERRAGLVQAVAASVRAVLGNFPVMVAWGLLLALLTVAAVVLVPLFPVVFPMLAYASAALYDAAFPPAEA